MNYSVNSYAVVLLVMLLKSSGVLLLH